MNLGISFVTMVTSTISLIAEDPAILSPQGNLKGDLHLVTDTGVHHRNATGEGRGGGGAGAPF